MNVFSSLNLLYLILLLLMQNTFNSTITKSDSLYVRSEICSVAPNCSILDDKIGVISKIDELFVKW